MAMDKTKLHDAVDEARKRRDRYRQKICAMRDSELREEFEYRKERAKGETSICWRACLCRSVLANRSKAAAFKATGTRVKQTRAEHITEPFNKVISLAVSKTMHEDVHAAAARAHMTVSDYLRRVIVRALKKEG